MKWGMKSVNIIIKNIFILYWAGNGSPKKISVKVLMTLMTK